MARVDMKSLDVYIPMDRRQALAKGKTLPERTVGAALSTRISGFTPLAQALDQELDIQRGAEVLVGHLDRVGNVLITEVHRYRGSVVGFSGEVITCWFDGDDGQRATTCALALQQTMTQFKTISTPAGTTIPFSLKVAVTSGPARRFLVGYPTIQSIEVLAGKTLDRLATAEQQLHQGEITVDAASVAQLGDNAQIRDRRAGSQGEQFAVVTSLNQPISPVPWPAIAELSAETACNWLLPPVFQRLQRGETEILTESRLCAVLFLKFRGIDYDQDVEAGEKLDAYVRWVQTVLARYEAYLLQLTVSQEGGYFYTAFGAPLAHEDDPARAIAGALELQSPPPNLNYIRDVQIGINRGQMRAGAYGGTARRIYGVFGPEVGIAAMLMARAEPGQILVTARIVNSVGATYAFQELGSISLPGEKQLVPAFAVRAKQPRKPPDFLKGRPLAPMVGRAVERAILTEHLHALLNGHKANVVIEGDAGIGKSRLIADMLEQAHALSISSFVGTASAIERTTPYYAWRSIFRELLDIQEMADATAIQKRLSAQLEDDPQLLERAPLLKVVLPLSLPDNDLTTQMSGEVRADNSLDLLVRVLARAQRAVPVLVLVLEDAHWMDSASWSLLSAVSQRIPNVLLVIAKRPTGDQVPAAYDQLLTSANTLYLKLEALPVEDSLALVCQRLGISELPPEISELIRAKAEGHPFFSEELAYALRDAGLIIVKDGLCRLSPEAKDWQNLDFPDTIQGVIASRIDRLSPGQQLTLKVASIIGRVFTPSILRDIHPVERDRLHLEEYFAVLEKLDIILPEAAEPEVAYLFKHIITQEVTYNMTPFSQRQEWHRAVAEWYELRFADHMSSHYPLLAHHWERAGAPAKAIDYYEKAGEQALLNFANDEAVTFFSQALRLDADTRPAGDTLRRARWELQLGTAYVNLTQYAEGRPHLEAGLALLGQPVPATQASQVMGILRQILRQTLHRAWPSRFVGSLAGDERATLVTKSMAYERLAEVTYFANETLLPLYSALHLLNSAEAAGLPTEMPRARATLGAMTGFVPLQSIAQAYVRRALEELEDVDSLTTREIIWIVSAVYYAGVGKWSTAIELLQKSAKVAESLGDQRRWRDSVGNILSTLQMQGQFKSIDEKIIDDLLAAAVAHNDVLFQVVALECKMYDLLHFDQLDEAVALLGQLQTLLEQGDEAVYISQRLDFCGYQALIHLRQAEYQQSFEAAKATLDLTAKYRPNNFSLVAAYSGPAEVFLTLWEEGYRYPDLSALAKQACKLLGQFAYIFPINQPRYWLWQGNYEWLSGKKSKARAAWRKSLNAASQLDMVYEQGLTAYQIGRHLAAADPERQEYLMRAIRIFDEMKAAYDLKQAQSVLQS
jgi:class 3 adenylate cyclase